MNQTVKLPYTPDFQPEALPVLEKIAANLPGMIFQFLQQRDGSQFVVYASSGCREMFELEPEVQTDFQILRKLIHPQDAIAFEESVRYSASTLTPWQWEGRIITPSGIKWIQGASRPERQAGGDILWDGLVMDITDRKQAESKLRESEARYKAILDAIPDLMFRISRDGEYLDFKGGGAKKAIPPENIIGNNLQDLLPDDVANNSLHAIAKTLDSQTLQSLEYQLSTHEGLRNYEARLVVSGQDEVLVLVRDITERKQAEIDLQNLAEKFSKAFRCSPNAITISTVEDGRFIEVNDSFVKLSGYEPEEAIGRTAFELNIWVNQSDRQKLLQELHSQGAVRNLEFEFRKKSGEVAFAMVCAEIIDLNGERYILSVNHDITQRKRTEAQLQLTSQRDRLLTETLARIRTSLNLDQILQTTVNEVRQFLQADRVFIGLNDGNKEGRILAESVDPKYSSVIDCKIKDPVVIQEMKRLLTTNKVRVVEDIEQIDVSPTLKAHYQQFQTRATLAVPIMLNGEFFGALIANQCSHPRHWHQMEIDLLKQMSEQLAIAIQQAQLYQELAALNTNLEQQVEERTAQLQQKMQELQEINRVKDVLLHTVSHDMRTSVMGNLMVLENLLKSGGVGSGEWGQGGQGGQFPIPNSQFPIPNSQIPVSRSIIERMIQGNQRLLGMINSLLELHSSEEQGIVLHRELVQFGTLLPTVIRDLQPMLSENKVTLKNLVPKDLPLIMADSTKLQRVLQNLLTYSWLHNPPGLNLTLKATVEDRMIRVQIQDNGVGMNKLECARLFDLFVRDPQARSSTCTGLKLYISRQIIKAHQGEIGVKSNPKRGLTFWFTLPLANLPTTSR
ncbi:multi-sensor signal transduction histidine kinase [Tolypothrix sp. NIES-4075]|uniref:sensor histidine kinase n=1 Tax=Tolypothrix sp. NIES-4075 TaxID=2005459 RepID=UPI000B5CA97C|nr:PAS domain S-box protein [Tolypothrix sp. NIES-4075]GAX42333.1 multi-sensor signal transduction histidine kinase [Tolypothrix sp. NIES-4075]